MINKKLKVGNVPNSKRNIPNVRFPGFNEEWDVKNLGDLCKMQAGKFINASEISDKKNDDLFPCFGGNGLRGYTKSYNQDGIYSLIGRQGALCGNVNLANGKFHATEHAIVVTPNDNIDTIWMFYLLTNLNLNQYSTGMAQPGLSVQNLEKIKTVFPKAKIEQQKIASFLSLIDRRITTQNKIIEQLETLIKGLSEKIFSQKIRFKEFTDEWKVKSLGEIGEIITGKTPSTSDLDLWDGDIQFVTPTDISENKYQYSTERTIKKTEKLKILPSKSIMFTCIASIGKMSLSLKPCVTNQQINSIIPNSDFNNEYVFYAIANISEFIKSTQSSSTMPIINKTEFSKFKISVPCLEEQAKIANFLSSIDSKIDVETQIMNKLGEQKKFLLQQMFV